MSGIFAAHRPDKIRCADLEPFVTGAPFMPVSLDRRRRGLPGSWGTPCARALLFDPGGTIRPGHLGQDDAAFHSPKSVGSLNHEISGLNDTARALAVYASQGGSPHHHARLASGCWPALPGGVFTHRVPLRSFRRGSCHLLPPRPGFAWRTRKYHPCFTCPSSIPIRASALT